MDSYSCIHYTSRSILRMSAFQHFQTLLDILKSPEALAKNPRHRDAARKALESLFMSRKDESFWSLLDKLRMDLSKVFDPTVTSGDTVAAHTRAVRLVADVMTKIRPATPAANVIREPACAA